MIMKLRLRYGEKYEKAPNKLIWINDDSVMSVCFGVFLLFRLSNTY